MTHNQKTVPWVVFDLGEVVFNLDFARYAEQTSALCGVPSLEFQRRYREHKCWNGLSLAEAMDRGMLSSVEFCAAFRELYGIDASDGAICEIKCSLIGSTKLDTCTLIEELVLQHSVACFSNTDVIHWTHRIMREPVMQLFKKRIASHEIKLRKPAPASYEKLCAILEVSPANCIFFDDLEENIVAARVFGIDAHVFTDAAQARRILQERNVF